MSFAEQRSILTNHGSFTDEEINILIQKGQCQFIREGHMLTRDIMALRRAGFVQYHHYSYAVMSNGRYGFLLEARGVIEKMLGCTVDRDYLNHVVGNHKGTLLTMDRPVDPVEEKMMSDYGFQFVRM